MIECHAMSVCVQQARVLFQPTPMQPSVHVPNESESPGGNWSSSTLRPSMPGGRLWPQHHVTDLGCSEKSERPSNMCALLVPLFMLIITNGPYKWSVSNVVERIPCICKTLKASELKSATTRAAAGMALEEPPELSAQASGPQAGQTPSDRTASTVRVLRGCHRRWRCAYLARKQMI
jgi:hypothetical protein